MLCSLRSTYCTSGSTYIEVGKPRLRTLSAPKISRYAGGSGLWRDPVVQKPSASLPSCERMVSSSGTYPWRGHPKNVACVQVALPWTAACSCTLPLLVTRSKIQPFSWPFFRRGTVDPVGRVVAAHLGAAAIARSRRCSRTSASRPGCWSRPRVRARSSSPSRSRSLARSLLAGGWRRN